MKAKAKLVPLGEDSRQAEAAKTARLRALRLAKEAAEKEEAIVSAVKPAKKRIRS